VASETEADIINALSPAERRARLLQTEAKAMRTYRYDDIPLTQTDAAGIREIDGIGAVDLSEEAAAVLVAGGEAKAYSIVIFEDDKSLAEGAEAVYIPAEGRLGIAWGSYADWASVDDIGLEAGIEMWLNDYETFEARN
jgi:hypothetical protein